MDSEVIIQHLNWVESIKHEYIQIEDKPEEFDLLFTIAGQISGIGMGMITSNWAVGVAAATVLGDAGAKIDQKMGL